MQVLFVVSCSLACIKNPLLISEVRKFTRLSKVRWSGESLKVAVGENLPPPQRHANSERVPNFSTLPTEQKYVLVWNYIALT